MGKIDKGDNVANKEMTRLRREGSEVVSIVCSFVILVY